MSTTNKGASALRDFFSAALALDKATAHYDRSAEAAIAADVLLLCESKALSQREIGQAVGLSDAAMGYHMAVLESCRLQNDTAPHQLRSVAIALHKCKGASLADVRKAIRALPDTASRSTALSMMRKAIIGATPTEPTAPTGPTGKESSTTGKGKETPNGLLIRTTSALSNIKDKGDITVASAAALLEQAQRIMTLVMAMSAPSTTVDTDDTDDETVVDATV